MSNQPEPMLKNSTHFAISAMMWFKKVRGGSMRLNYTELVRNLHTKYVDRGGSVVSNHPEPMLKNSTHFAISEMMCGSSRRFDALELHRTSAKAPCNLASPLNM